MTLSPPASVLTRLLNRVERVGNALPHPATLFLLLTLVVLLLSALTHASGLAVVHPATGATVGTNNLLSIDGLRRLILGLLPNFINFAPLGSVLVCVLGLSVAEHSGLLRSSVRLIVGAAHPRVLTLVVVFAGAMSHTAGDVGYVLLLPLSCALFHSVGRHPLAGLAAAFSGVSGGFAANLLLSPTDVILAGLTQEAARIVSAGAVVSPMANYYFLGASVFLVTAVGTIVTERAVEPRLGSYRGEIEPAKVEPLTTAERRGLRWAAVSLVILIALTLAGLLPEQGYLNDPERPGFTSSYFLRGLVFFIFVFGVVPGVAYGVATGTIRSDTDVYRGMQKTLELLAGYLVVVFFIAQFVAVFNWTNLGLVLAVEGAGVLRSLNLGPIPLLVGLVVLTAGINLFLGSSSAKWALLAPIFVPMFMLLGYSPELTQAAYRVGDSVTNIITPLMSNFPLVLMFAQRYEPKAGIGTMTAMMLPYSVANLFCWSTLLIIWVWLGIPVGPGAGLFLPQ